MELAEQLAVFVVRGSARFFSFLGQVNESAGFPALRFSTASQPVVQASEPACRVAVVESDASTASATMRAVAADKVQPR